MSFLSAMEGLWTNRRSRDKRKKKNKRIIIHTADIHAIFVRRITYWK